MSGDYPADRDSVDVSFRTGLLLQDIAPLWRGLEASVRPSFFLSWDWIGCWLKESSLSPELLIARRNGEPIALALLQPEKPGTSRPIRHLTASGNPEFDSVFIEYNGLLATSRDQIPAARAFQAFLAGPGMDTWSSLHLPGVGPETRKLWPEDKFIVRTENEREAPLIDLAALRSAGTPYLASRSANSRQQIRRSMRLFAEQGELRLEAPETLDEAYVIFEELKALHQKTWQARGKPGAFATPFFERFHRALIEDAWPKGRIDLLRLRTGTQTIGCLYNFLHEGEAYSYQSGFKEFEDSRCKPGLVSHTLAAERYLETGISRYLLLAGDSRYKTSLSTEADRLEWLVIRKRGWRAALEDFATRARRKLGG